MTTNMEDKNIFNIYGIFTLFLVKRNMTIKYKTYTVMAVLIIFLYLLIFT